jgi:DNA-binding transcriptional LysR family regulator
MNDFMSMKAFVEVAQRGSFARAAQTLGLSRAMVTKHIRQLEDNLGARLLNRTSRQLSLTEVGIAYRARCLQILADVEEANSAATQSNSQPSGVLRVTAPPSFGTFHLAPAVAAYIAAYPQVEIAMTLSDRNVDLAEEGQDLAIQVGILPDSNLIAHRIAHAEMIVCGAPAYFQRRGIPDTPEELANHDCLRYATHSLHHDRWEFVLPQGTVGVPVRGPLTSNTGDVLRIAAIHGLGLVLQPTYMVGEDLETGLLQAVLGNYEAVGIDINAIYLHRKHLSAKVRTFVEFLKSHFATRY